MILTSNRGSHSMTLGNRRSLGVRSLAVTCELHHHRAILGG
jgi:hypothetical protein